jgi:hypothetical protein
VLKSAGLGTLREAAETPFNLISEARQGAEKRLALSGGTARQIVAG